MKVLIGYCSKYGCTEDAAKLLAQRLEGDVTLQNLAQARPDPALYDLVVLGGPVYAGVMPKALRAYCKANEQALLHKPLGLFVGCSELSPAETQYLAANLPGPLVEKAVTLSVGGEFRPEGMNPFERLILKLAGKAKGGGQAPGIDGEGIRRFADALMALPKGR